MPRWRLYATSLLWAGGIALLACVLAWVPAWAMRGVRGWLMPLVLLPMLMPSYLAYHALGMVRAPTTWIGEILARAPEHGWPGIPVLAGHVLAIVGLGLWSWPIGVLVLVPAVRSIDQSVLDVMRVDGVGWWTRQWHSMRMLRVAVLRAWGLLTIVMLGSAVPLHLAQAPTLSVAAWLEAVLRPGTAGVWVVSWPLLVLAFVASWVITGRLGARGAWWETEESGDRARSGGVRAAAWTVLLCGLSVLLPVALYLGAIRGLSSIQSFLRLSGSALWWSVLVAGVVGVCGVCVCVLTWRAWSMTRQGLARVAVFGLLVGVLMPGVLVGHAWATLWSLLPVDESLRESVVGLVLAHLTRFAGLGAWCGVVLAELEHRHLRDARVLEAGQSLTGWWRATAKPLWWGAAGAGLALACLSLHEVEATIVLQPPGLTSLAQTMLSNLHFARQDETSAGALVVLGSGLIPALLAAWLLGRLARKSARSL